MVIQEKEVTSKIFAGLRSATGEIEYTLKTDVVFHYALQNSRKARIGLVSALKGIEPSEIEDVIVLNPIDFNNFAKETIMDLKLLLNNGTVINIELQMYMEPCWTSKSLLYLCRAYDSIGKGDNYTLLKPTYHYCITDRELVDGAEPEFYAKYRLLNIKDHRPYTENFGINVLNLNHIDLATPEDRKCKLDYWAQIFKVTTWDELNNLVKEHADMEEVAALVYEINTDQYTKEILEGQRRYQEQLATQYAAGQMDTDKKYEKIIADKDAAIEDRDAAIANKDATIANKDAIIAEKDDTIAKLQAEIEALKNR